MRLKTSPRGITVKKRAYTLIELTIVISIVALFAAAVVPNVFGRKRSADIREFYAAARRTAMDARETAISSNEALFLSYDETQHRFVLSRQQVDSDQKMEVSHVDLPAGMTSTLTRLGSNDVNASDWSVGFYPDGTSDGGGIVFVESGANWSMAVDTHGYVTSQAGDLPADTNASWPAGTYEKRL